MEDTVKLLSLAYLLTYLILISHSPAQESASAGRRGLPFTQSADTSFADVFVKKAKAFQQKSQYDSSISYFEKAKVLYEQSRAWDKYVRSLTKIGENLIKKGDFEKASSVLNDALHIGLQELGEKHLTLTETHLHLGHLHRFKGNLDKALELSREALSIQSASLPENDPSIADSYLLQGAIYRGKGEYDSALQVLHKSLLILGEHAGEKQTKVGLVYNDIGLAYDDKGDYERAVESYNNALNFMVDTQAEPLDVAAVYNNIAVIFFRRADYDRALEFYHKSLSIQEGLLGEHHPEIASMYNNIAMVYRSLGEYDKGLEYGEKAKTIFVETLGDHHPRTAIAINNMGRTYADKREYMRALEFYQSALSIWKEKLGESHPYVAQSYYNIGEAFGKVGDHVKAVAYLKESMVKRLSVLGERHPKVAQSYAALANVYAGQKNFDTALQDYQKSIAALVEGFADSNSHVNPTLEKISSHVDLLNTLTSKAEALEQRYDFQSRDVQDLQSSLATYQVASQLVENIRHGYKAEESKLAIVKTAVALHDKGIRTAVRLYDRTRQTMYNEAAFTFAERAKSGVLSDALSEADAKQFSGLPDSLLQREKELRVDLAFTDTQIQKEKQKGKSSDSFTIENLEEKFFGLNREYERLIEGFEKNYPKYYNLKYQFHTASVTEVQNHLPDNQTALVEYVIADTGAFIFVLTKTQCSITFTRVRGSLEELVKKFRGSLQNLDFDGYLNTANRLYRVLIGPVQKQLVGIKMLYVIPDGVLNYLPFEALVTKPLLETDAVDFARLPYLIRDFEISYHFSATLLTERRPGEPDESRHGFVGLAPVFSERAAYAEGSQTAIPFSDTTQPEIFAAVKRSISVDGKQYSALPHSEAELKEVLRLFEQKGRPARAFLHNSADESVIKSPEMQSYRYVHVATHGFINEHRPKLSGIIFARPEGSSTEDGVLYSGEIYNLRLGASLVVLSACESGLGKVVRGEGILGLTRGFIYAGAENLIVSLWQIADESTAKLMVAFYRNVLEGGSYASALRRAKLSLIKEGKYAYPLEWSPFVLIGG